MRRRLHPKPTTPAIEVVGISKAARLVTLGDPDAPPTLARDAFARLKPPEGTSPDAVTSWRDSVAKVARAVRVVATPTAAAVPVASTRVDETEVGSIREEALQLAEETKNPHVVELVARLLDEVGA